MDADLVIDGAAIAKVTGAVVTLGDAQEGDALTVDTSSVAAITASGGTGGVALTLTGEAPKADYQAVLRTVKFSPGIGTTNAARTVSFQVQVALDPATIGLHNTGLDASGNVITEFGNEDAHWNVRFTTLRSDDPDKSATPPASTDYPGAGQDPGTVVPVETEPHPAKAFRFQPEGPNKWATPPSGAEWVTWKFASGSGPGGRFLYTLDLNLSALSDIEQGSLEIAGKWSADDFGPRLLIAAPDVADGLQVTGGSAEGAGRVFDALHDFSVSNVPVTATSFAIDVSNYGGAKPAPETEVDVPYGSLTGALVVFESATASVAASRSVSVTVGDAASISVTTQPADTEAGAAIEGVPNGAPGVTVVDEYSNPLAGVSVTVSLTGGAFSSGTTTATTDENGVATFDDLTITTAGSYTLTFSVDDASPAVTATSEAFDVTAAAAARLFISTQPVGNVPSGSSLTTQPVVQIHDAYGNTVTSATHQVSVAIASGTGGTLTGTTSVNAVNGVATFTDLALAGTVDDPYTLEFSATDLSSVTSHEVLLSGAGPADADKSSVVADPTTVPADGVTASTIRVTVTDASGNAVSGLNVVLTQGDGQSAISPATATLNAGGVATFTVTSTEVETATYTAVVDPSGVNVTLDQTASVTFASVPPANVAVPVISGAPTAGQTVTSAEGTWTGTMPMTFAYQWVRCDAAGNNCAPIGGATAPSYTLTAVDVGATLRVVVTATNGGGSADATSVPTVIVVAEPVPPPADVEPPVNVEPPTIEGTVDVGHVLAAARGTWTGTPELAYAYQWQRCAPAGEPCTNVSGATGKTYTVAGGDEGATFRVVVTATNSAGSASVTSAPTQVVAEPPVNVTPPTISGTPHVGETFTATEGTWRGRPTPSLGFQWQRCDSAGTACLDIPGATGREYTTTDADTGATLRVVVTATNPRGQAAAASAPSAPIVYLPSLETTIGATGAFVRGQQAAQLVVGVRNTGRADTRTGTTVRVAPGPGLQAMAGSGDGWTCRLDGPALVCTRPDALGAGAAYPRIDVTSSVSVSAPDQVTAESIAKSADAGARATTTVPVVANAALLVDLEKRANRSVLKVGDVVELSLAVRSRNMFALTDVVIHVQPPAGFRLLPGTTRRGVEAGAPAAESRVADEPAIDEHGRLTFAIGTLAPDTTHTLRYDMVVTPDAQSGEHVSEAMAFAVGPLGDTVETAPVSVRVTVTGTPFSYTQMLIGRVFEDRNGNGRIDRDEPGVAGVRVVTSTGLSATTDGQGMYNLPALAPGSVAVVVDPATLPSGLAQPSSRAATGLLRTPLESGGLLRQNFPLVRVTPAQSARPVAAFTLPEEPGPQKESEAAGPLRLAADRTSMPAGGRDVARVRVVAGDVEGQSGTTAVIVRVDRGRLIAPVTGGTPDDCRERLYTDAGGAQQEVVVDLVDGAAEVCVVSDMHPGVAHVTAMDAASARVTASLDLQYGVASRAPVLVALAEAGVALTPADRHDPSAARRTDAQVSMFFQDSVTRDDLLTVALRSRGSLNEATGLNGLFRFDPTLREYPVLGDASTQQALVQANSRWYARYDRTHSYLLAGDLQADAANGRDDGLRWLEFGRNLTGVRFRAESASTKDWLQVQAARPRTAYMRDVLTAVQGTALRLSRSPILIGSENVTAEVRDRRSPERLVSRETLVRNVDYNLDPSTGVIYLLRPLAVLDSALNVTTLVVAYEYQGEGFDSMVYLGRGSRGFEGIGLRLTGSMLVQREDTRDFAVGGVQLDQRLPGSGRVSLEVPVSGGSVPTSLGRASVGPARAASTDTAAAVRLEFLQPFGGSGSDLAVRFARTPDAFANPFGQLLVTGQERFDGSVRAALTPRTTLTLAAGRERNETAALDNERATVSGAIRQALGSLRVDGGVDRRQYRNHLTGDVVRSSLVSAGAEWQATRRLSASARREQNVGSGADPTYPTQTLLGARYRASATSELFATQRLSSAPIVPISNATSSGLLVPLSTQETAIGVESRLFSRTNVTSRYSVQNGINGSDAFALVGVVTRVPVRHGLSIDWGFDQARHLSGPGRGYVGGSIGASYLPADRYRASFRYDVRDQGGAQHGVTAGMVGQVVSGATMLARYRRASVATSDAAPVAVTDGELALAVRPLSSDRGSLLFSYAFGDIPAPATAVDVSGSRSDRVGVDGLLELPSGFELYGRAAVVAQPAAAPATREIGRLAQMRLQRPLIWRFDAAGELRWIRESSRDAGRTVTAVEWGAWILPELRVGIGYSSGPFALPGSALGTTASRGGSYVAFTSRLSRIFDLMPGTAR